jgi:hypothetical protein
MTIAFESAPANDTFPMSLAAGQVSRGVLA